MSIFKRRHKILLPCGVILCALFLLGESDRGQELLRGKAGPNETHFEADDRFMGAGLAPLVYCLLPGGSMLIYVAADLVLATFRKRNLID
jgi:hypothetical protein